MNTQEIKDAISRWPMHWALGGSDPTGGLCQNRYELQKLCEFIVENDIKSYTEIGIENGYMLKFMQKDIGLDVDGIECTYKDIHIGLPVVYGMSQDPEIVKNARNVDLIFVDGDHTYTAVKQDYENYKSKCKWMAFHDILGLRNCEGVFKLWSEIKDQYQYWEFMDTDLSIASGIGIIKIK